MKIEEVILFNLHGPVDDELIKNWKSYTSELINYVQTTVDEDDFLREKLDELKVEWNYRPEEEYPFFAHIDRKGPKTSKDLIINMLGLERAENLKQNLLFELYKLPGEEKNTNRLPSVQKKLKKWVDKLGNDFFVLYPSYHSQLKAAGIQLGLMKNHPEYKQRIYDLYRQILETGVLGKGTYLHDLGDLGIERLERGFPKKRSLLKLGAFRLLLGCKDDYLAHYVVGTPISTMTSVFPLTNSKVGTEMGKELKEKLNNLYKGSDPLVSERLSEHAKLIGQDTFDECFYPSLTEEENYLFLVEKYLGDCVAIKESMQQKNTHSSIKPESDKRYMIDVFDFSNATREQVYRV